MLVAASDLARTVHYCVSERPVQLVARAADTHPIHPKRLEMSAELQGEHARGDPSVKTDTVSVWCKTSDALFHPDLALDDQLHAARRQLLEFQLKPSNEKEKESRQCLSSQSNAVNSRARTRLGSPPS